MIDLSKDEIEEMYWTNSNRVMAEILGIPVAQVTVLVDLNNIERKGAIAYGYQSMSEFEDRRERIIKKISERRPAIVRPNPEASTIEKLDIAVKGLEKILEISDNAYVLELVHNTLKRLKK